MWKVFLVITMLFYLGEGKPMAARRDLCPVGGGDKDVACDYWESLGYCDPEKGYTDITHEKCPVACGLCEARPTPPPKPQIVQVNIGECLEAHNSKREMHGAKPLTWDDSLAKHAEEWALYLANENIFKHADPSGEGENIYDKKKLEGRRSTCAEAVESWYKEVEYYDFQHPPKDVLSGGPVVGHFTQVVWKSTDRVGVSIVAIQRGYYTQTIVVARYKPAGNGEGQFGNEVAPASTMARK